MEREIKERIRHEKIKLAIKMYKLNMQVDYSVDPRVSQLNSLLRSLMVQGLVNGKELL